MNRIAICLLPALLSGCAGSPSIEYQVAPAWLIPAKPELPKIQSADLACLSDETYFALAARDRELAEYEEQLRALLGVTK